jgi:membrane-associated phospholipid phosphatase
MKKIFFIAIVLWYTSLSAQERDTSRTRHDSEDTTRLTHHVYHVNFWGSTAITLGTELAILAAQLTPMHDKPDISNAEFDLVQSQPSLDQINPIDRLSLHIGVPAVDYTYTAADLQIVCAAAPLALLFGEKFRKNWDDIILLMAEVNAINMFTFQFSPFGPFFQKRYRPIVYYAYTPAERNDAKVGSNRVSFYSGHVSAATTSLYLMAKIYCDYNPQIQGWDKIGIYALASIPPLAMGYLRIIALKHWPSDVLVGGLVGGTIGIVVPEMHRITDKTVSLGLYSSPESTGLRLAWNFQ